MKDLEDMGRPEKPLSTHGGKGEDRFDSAITRRRADEEEAFYDDEVPAPLPSSIPAEARETAANSDGDAIMNTDADRDLSRDDDDEDDDDDDVDEQIDKTHLRRRLDAYKTADPVSPSRLRGLYRPAMKYDPVEEAPVRRYKPTMEYEPFTPEPIPLDGPVMDGAVAPLPVYRPRPTYDGEYDADADADESPSVPNRWADEDELDRAVDSTSFDKPMRGPKRKFKVFGKHKKYGRGKKRHHKQLRDVDMEDEDAVISRRTVDMEADDDEPSVLKFDMADDDDEPVPVKSNKKRKVKSAYTAAKKRAAKLKKKKSQK